MDHGKDGKFPTTAWTLIARLKGRDHAEAKRALDEICAQYRYPLYCYIRRSGLDHHDAEDTLHDFLAKLLRLEVLESADKQKGRLRALLVTALHRFLHNRHRDQARRPEGQLQAQMDGTDSAENAERYSHEKFRNDETPEHVFERKWAQDLLRHVLRQLENNYAARGKSMLFKKLKPILMSGGSLRGEGVADLAKSLEMRENSFRVAHSRLLRDFRSALESEVRQTVGMDTEVKEEIAYLRGLFEQS